jgi:NADH-quinone oxidoreductase subunit C
MTTPDTTGKTPAAPTEADAGADKLPKKLTRLETLEANLKAAFGDRIRSLVSRLGELTLVVAPKDYLAVAEGLRDRAELGFDELLDLCGVDYEGFGETLWEGDRFTAVSHLLSLTNNWRLRLKTFAADDDFPVLPSLTGVWNSAGWYEREAFDLYGIVFEGHADLRRILTDYGFVGHPFRKDFPISGNVEMRYDPEQKRVIYQPVTIEPREIVPRVIREEGYGGLKR